MIRKYAFDTIYFVVQFVNHYITWFVYHGSDGTIGCYKIKQANLLLIMIIYIHFSLLIDYIDGKIEI